MHHRHRVVTVERQLAGTHSEQDDAQAEQVAAGRDLFAATLFRRHVRGRAEDGPAVGQMHVVVRDAGQAEVEQLRAIVRNPWPVVRSN